MNERPFVHCIRTIHKRIADEKHIVNLNLYPFYTCNPSLFSDTLTYSNPPHPPVHVHSST